MLGSQIASTSVKGVTRRFDPDPSSVPDARCWVRKELEGLDLLHRRRVVELLTTEMVSNVVMHVGEPFELRMRFDGEMIRVEVADTSPSLPYQTDAGPDAVSGRGFSIVRKLSRRCGVDSRTEGKVVWFEVDAFRQFSNSAPGAGRTLASH